MNKFFDDVPQYVEDFVNKSVDISDVLEDAMTIRNLSNKELADRLDVKELEVENYLSGTYDFKISEIVKIEDTLNIKLI